MKISEFLSNVSSFFKMVFSALFGSKKEKIRNKNLLKRGGYATMIVAIVVASAIVLNLLVGLLAKRVNLEFDITAEKRNSISEENREYLKGVEKPVNIYILAASDSDYYGGYMQYYAQQMGYSAQTSDYYKQTTTFLTLYDEINENITVKYVDPYGTEMSQINTDYPEQYNYGDILVTSEFTAQSGAELKNHKLLSFIDIYNYSDLSGSAAMGYDYYYVTGSRLETALTSAIASVTSEDTKKVAFISGHGGSDAFKYYGELLELNNFIVEEIDDNVISAIDPSFDAVVICAPTTDFMGGELDVLNDFLDNEGNKGKTLLFFGDSGYQRLPNLYEFMGEWGIEISQGIVFEANDSYHLANSYSTFLSASATGDSDIITAGSGYITGYNVPMKENGEPYGSRDTTTLLKTLGSSAVMPLGTESSVKPDEAAATETFSTLIISEEADFKDSKAVSSYVLAFSSIDFISEEYVLNYSSLDYKGMILKALQVPTGMNSAEITFENKTIESTSSLYITSETSSKFVLIFFTIVLPVCFLVMATVIFAKRRNL